MSEGKGDLGELQVQYVLCRVDILLVYLHRYGAVGRCGVQVHDTHLVLYYRVGTKMQLLTERVARHLFKGLSFTNHVMQSELDISCQHLRGIYVQLCTECPSKRYGKVPMSSTVRTGVGVERYRDAFLLLCISIFSILFSKRAASARGLQLS